MQQAMTATLGSEIYSLICSRGGITAREIAREIGADRKAVNQCLYGYPFISDFAITAKFFDGMAIFGRLSHIKG